MSIPSAIMQVFDKLRIEQEVWDVLRLKASMHNGTRWDMQRSHFLLYFLFAGYSFWPMHETILFPRNCPADKLCFRSKKHLETEWFDAKCRNDCKQYLHDLALQSLHQFLLLKSVQHVQALEDFNNFNHHLLAVQPWASTPTWFLGGGDFH